MSPNFPPHFNLEWKADLEISTKSVLPQYKYTFWIFVSLFFIWFWTSRTATRCRNIGIQTVFLCLLQSNQICCLWWQTVIFGIGEQSVNWHLILSTDSTACSIFAFSYNHLICFTLLKSSQSYCVLLFLPFDGLHFVWKDGDGKIVLLVLSARFKD